ncbi:MAG TPA: endonuclease V [Candidatus Paceibacterota bacterium]|nr:endonuclease V [Candidatus Paceibacterota bacterium]
MLDHSFDVSIAQAKDIQERLRHAVRLLPLSKEPQTIAGADISYNRFSSDFFAAVVVLAYPSLEEVEQVFARGVATFPYVPGYLSFRELPTLLAAFEKLKTKPDVIMADGQGIAHPRRLGLASHLGLALDIPTFGCAKSMLYGEVHNEGGMSYLYDPKDRTKIGALVHTKKNTKPVVISPGHLISLEDSVRIAQGCVRGYRIPEPTRRAHELVNAFRRGDVPANTGIIDI